MTLPVVGFARPLALSVPAVGRVLAWGSLLWMGVAAAMAESPLVDRELAARMGLERAWFAQVPVDVRQSRVSRWEFHSDRVYSVSSSGLLTALDSETGETVWTSRVGKPGYAAFGPGANREFVAAVSGARLYVYDRDDGRLLWTRELGSAPSSGPALTSRHAFVALANGQIEAYRLDAPTAQPWYYQSKGRTFERPTATGAVVSWPTDSGLLYVSSARDPQILFRFETHDEIVAPPAELAPYIYVASLDGSLYSIHEINGRERWRFATGTPVTSSPAVFDDAAYVASTEPSLHAVELATGAPLWKVAGIEHFAARGKQAVYAQASNRMLVAIDRATGDVRGRLPLGEGISALVNDQTDRIFLVNSMGLVQCLREFDALEPALYRKPPAPRDKAPSKEEASSEVREAESAAAERADADANAEAPADVNPFDDPSNPGAEPAGDPEAGADDDEDRGGASTAEDEASPFQ